MYLVTIQRGHYDNHPFYGENYDYGYREIATFDFEARAIEFLHSEKQKYKEKIFHAYKNDEEDCVELIMPPKDGILYGLVLTDSSECGDCEFIDFTIRCVEDGTIITTGDSDDV